MRNRLLLAAAGLLGAISFAPAQQFAPKPINPTPIGSVAPAPLPAVISPIIPASARSVVHQAGCGPVVAYGEGCAAPVAGKSHDRSRNILGKFLIGHGTINPVSCGCLASDRSFVFSSCRAFYNPISECGSHGCSGCWPVDRRPPGLGVTSYLNR